MESGLSLIHIFLFNNVELEGDVAPIGAGHRDDLGRDDSVAVLAVLIKGHHFFIEFADKVGCTVLIEALHLIRHIVVAAIAVSYTHLDVYKRQRSGRHESLPHAYGSA